MIYHKWTPSTLTRVGIDLSLHVNFEIIRYIYNSALILVYAKLQLPPLICSSSWRLKVTSATTTETLKINLTTQCFK